MKIYLAGPLFSEAETRWGREVKRTLEGLSGVEVVWPHEIVPAGSSVAPGEIFRSNLAALSSCDVLVAILDGPAVDDGTSWEVGYHYASGKPVIGIRTDFRRAGETGDSLVNAMIECSCSAIARNLEDLYRQTRSLL